MPITDEQAKTIKEQLIIQVEKLPSLQREQAKSYISSLNNKQLEEFLVQNQMMQKSGEAQQSEKLKKGSKISQCVFCALANKQIGSFAIYEDKDYIAVLEIKPFSNGHTILIPKKHIKETKSLRSRAFTVANKVGKHLAKKLKAESFQLSTTAEIGHAIINIIPSYKSKPITYERSKPSKQELQELTIKVGEVKKREVKAPKLKKAKTKSSEKEEESQIIKLPRRIP